MFLPRPKGYSFHVGFGKYLYMEVLASLKSAIVDVLCKLGETLGGPSIEMSFLISMGMIRTQGSGDRLIALNPWRQMGRLICSRHSQSNYNGAPSTDLRYWLIQEALEPN